MYKPLTLVSSGTTGEAKLSPNPDPSDLEPGIYQLAVTESSDSGVTVPIVCKSRRQNYNRPRS